ncbi:tail assembly chaperone [Enterobacter sp. CPE_E423]|uniref:tail assembly chaperone n=1 Tax=unclassified Enterobacter TaxID=2608935 RepID=UPI003974FB7E
MSNYVWSTMHLAFFPKVMLNDYENAGWDLSDITEIDDLVFQTFTSAPPEGKQLGVVNGMPAWVEKPLPPNSELRKAALTSLSKIYQDDIFNLNMAWVAAGVNDGVNEIAKKDVVLAQINNRKTQYAIDRAAIIAQYPD